MIFLYESILYEWGFHKIFMWGQACINIIFSYVKVKLIKNHNDVNYFNLTWSLLNFPSLILISYPHPIIVYDFWFYLDLKSSGSNRLFQFPYWVKLIYSERFFYILFYFYFWMSWNLLLDIGAVGLEGVLVSDAPGGVAAAGHREIKVR